MEAWVNLFAYVMQGMLPSAIKGIGLGLRLG
jgi:hypothetical protein